MNIERIENQRTKGLESVFYRIAGLLIEIIIPAGWEIDRLLPTGKAFKVTPAENETVICTLAVLDDKEKKQSEGMKDARLLSDTTGLFNDHTRVFETKSQYIVTITLEGHRCSYRMESSKDFAYSTIQLEEGRVWRWESFTLFLMIAFSQTAVLHKTVLIHASAIVREGVGYAFLGKSGTGKSTHSRLWIDYIEGSYLLNDDNPAVRVKEDGTIHIYGTPWSGKTPCYKNEEVPLVALVRLEQAPSNRFSEQKGAAAMISLLPSCSSMRWSYVLYTALCNVLELIIKQTAICRLECLPDQDAAELCYHKIKNNRNK